MIELISRRIALRDCSEHGWILEGFPQTRAQAKALIIKGINPQNVFMLQVPTEEVYKRTESGVLTDFSCDRTILVRHLDQMSKHLPETAFFFQKYYNSLSNIDGLKSRWFTEDVTLEALEKTMKARLSFARDYFFKYISHGEERPCVMQDLNYDRKFLKQSLSQYKYVCPVTWRQGKRFANCVQRPEFAVLYSH